MVNNIQKNIKSDLLIIPSLICAFILSGFISHHYLPTPVIKEIATMSIGYSIYSSVLNEFSKKDKKSCTVKIKKV